MEGIYKVGVFEEKLHTANMDASYNGKRASSDRLDSVNALIVRASSATMLSAHLLRTLSRAEYTVIHRRSHVFTT